MLTVGNLNQIDFVDYVHSVDSVDLVDLINLIDFALAAFALNLARPYNWQRFRALPPLPGNLVVGKKSWR